MHHDRETGHFTVSADIHVSICGCNVLLTINVKKIRNSFFWIYPGSVCQFISVSVYPCVLSLLSTLLQLTKFNIREVSTSKRVQFQKALLCIWMHFCREQSLKFMRHMPESRLLQLANSTDILVSVENYQSCYLELLSMNTSRYGLSSNDMLCSSGFIKLCNIGNCIKGKFR